MGPTPTRGGSESGPLAMGSCSGDGVGRTYDSFLIVGFGCSGKGCKTIMKLGFCKVKNPIFLRNLKCVLTKVSNFWLELLVGDFDDGFII